jgi:HlyD family secretion protein
MIRNLILISLLTAAVAVAWYATRQEPVEVRLATLAAGTVESIVANTRSGTIKACRRARLAPSVGGQIAELPVTEGQRVAAGDLLLALWNDDLKARLRLAGSEVDAARAKVEAACLRTAQAQREARRLEKLYKRGVASVDEADKAQTEARALDADCAAAKAAVQVKEAQVGLVRAKLTQTRLTAPFSGVVAEVTGELHEYVTPSPPGIPTPPAIDLIDDQCFYVSAPIDEVDAPKVMVDQSARVSLDAFGERHFEARVRRIAPYVLDFEKQARTVEIEVELTGDGATGETSDETGTGETGHPVFLAGYSADVEVITGRHDQVLRLPTEALMENDRVYLYHENSGILEQRHITPGLANWQWTEVVTGLAAGDRVVISLAQEGLEDGVAATPEPDPDRDEADHE